MSRAHHAGVVGAGLLAVSLTGCFAVTDLDRFKNECDGDLNTRRDFTAEIKNLVAFMGPVRPANARVELRVVNKSLVNVARAVINGLDEQTESVSLKVFMPRAIPPGEHQVHVYIDLNHNGRYDREGVALIATGTEPSWISDMCPSGLFRFTASETLQDIEDPQTTPLGGLFALQLTELHPHLGGNQNLELLVLHDADDVPSIGYFRHPGVTDETMPVAIPGIIARTNQYRIDFYIDKDQNGGYSGPPRDHSWRLELAADGDTLVQTWQHTGVFNDVEF